MQPIERTDLDLEEDFMRKMLISNRFIRCSSCAKEGGKGEVPTRSDFGMKRGDYYCTGMTRRKLTGCFLSSSQCVLSHDFEDKNSF